MGELDRFVPDAETAAAVAAFLALLALIVWLCARILRRAGMPGWLSLFVLVPGWNLLAVWVFAFVPWPVEGGRRALLRSLSRMGRPDRMPPRPK